jgi:hypothetical protein
MLALKKGPVFRPPPCKLSSAGTSSSSRTCAISSFRRSTVKRELLPRMQQDMLRKAIAGYRAEAKIE